MLSLVVQQQTFGWVRGFKCLKNTRTKNRNPVEQDTLIQAIDKIERLEKQLEIAKAVIYSVLHDKFINENADAGLVMYITGAYQKIKDLEK